MPKLWFRTSMSLYGIVAGTGQCVEEPLGVGGRRLHEWVLELTAFRSLLSLEGGAVNEGTSTVEEPVADIGATARGRDMPGGHSGPWDAARPWNGWRGVNSPLLHPVFALTHCVREPLELEGGTTFTFVTAGVERALQPAMQAGGGRDVSFGGEESAARQTLAAGVVDKGEVNIVPTLLGHAERLREGLGDDLHGLELVRTVAPPKVTHLEVARR